MATIFISHSHHDDEIASDLGEWLKANGFDDFFIDHSSIKTGESWADALRASTGACRVVICLVTEQWLASPECTSEFRAAWYMGKYIAPLYLIEDESALPETSHVWLRRLRSESQGLNLRPFLTDAGRLDFRRDDDQIGLLHQGLRSAGAMSTVGLDPNSFDIDAARRPSPFPGLSAFGDDDADAAVFFGRSREIAEMLEEIRAMRAANDQRILMILGASGAGKSSLLRAGVIPRLRREAGSWIPLRAFRPGPDPLLNFAEAITKTLEDYQQSEAYGDVRQRLEDAWRADALGDELAKWIERLRAAANRPQAKILVSVDQAEELTRSEGVSGDVLTDYFRAMTRASESWQLILTLRTDNFAEVQAHRRLNGLEARGYDLRTMPPFKFADVLKRPADRYRVALEPALVEQLMEDAPGKDALPLLAFATQRLWDQFSAKGQIDQSDYAAMGGLAGIIEGAAERALQGIEPTDLRGAALSTGPDREQADLGARTFVPPLADLNDEGGVIRRVAQWREFDGDQQALLDRFDRWRLVVKKGDAGTVEVAHEAIFREWPRLASWLEPERTRLEALRGLEIATADWERNGQRRSYASHSGHRLKALVQLRSSPRYQDQIGAAESAYVEACQSAAWLRIGAMVGAILSLPLIAGFAMFSFAVMKDVRAGWLQSQATRNNADFIAAADALAAAPPGAQFQDCAPRSSQCPMMTIIPGGRFLMGSLEDDEDANADEFPQREIVVRRFAVSTYEITWDEWEACLAAGGCDYYRPDDNQMGRGRKPVVGISWRNAQDYVAWLSAITDARYRLLSEAEWEYAARGATILDPQGESYPWGNDPPVCDRAAKAGAVFSSCEPQGTHDVGQFAPNGFGLYDMSGNIWEWVEDCYARYDPAKADAAAVGAARGDCAEGVLRSGSWIDSRQDLRAAYRLKYDPSAQLNVFGFRVARDLEAR